MRNAPAARTRNSAIGTSLATVTRPLMIAAVRRPRSTSRCTVHSSTDDAAMAAGVLPSPNTGAKWPMPLKISTKKLALPSTEATQ
ncbi:hypothetical protein D3C78_1664390 [compost metagenome]